jgi:hypothetical protein
MIPKSEWLQVYVAIKLLKFYAISSNNGDVDKVKEKYQAFLNTEFADDNERNDFDSIPNLLSFAYLTLVRSHELLDRYVKENVDALYNTIENNLNLKTDTDFLVRYSMVIMLWENMFDDSGKVYKQHLLQSLVNKIRNSISHFRYTITDTNILFQDGSPPKPDQEFIQNFRISLPANNFLNLTIDFASLMSDYLKNNNLIDWENKKV